MKQECPRSLWATPAALAMVIAGMVPLAHAGYLVAKARLAQVLLERAWQQSRVDHAATPPWPWADTTPVARLHVTRLGIDEIVLSGDSGRTLAFGPGWSPASAPPGTHGLTVISAHRDTHFSFLRSVVRNDDLAIETAHGTFRYRVTDLQVIDSRNGIFAGPAAENALLLVTCFPFDAILPGGPLRYVVTAVPSTRGMNQPQAVSRSSSTAHGDALAVR